MPNQVPHSMETPSPVPKAPAGLLCDLLAYPERTVIRTQTPTFGWMVNGGQPGQPQSAYQIKLEILSESSTSRELIWDSGRVVSGQSIGISHDGLLLQGGVNYIWSVRTWAESPEPSAWSPSQTFTIVAEPGKFNSSKESTGSVSIYPLETIRVEPVHIDQLQTGMWAIDFGKQAFGWLELEIESREEADQLTVRLSEAFRDGALDRNPPGSVRFAEAVIGLKRGRHRYRVETPVDARNTGQQAIHLPAELGTVIPFRYVELEAGAAPNPTPILHGAEQIRLEYPFDGEAARFQSSCDLLNRIWELCHHSIRATSFAGLYVDGDRERIPYEADAYINQLSHYAVDREFSLARRTHEYLLRHPTWPTEWKQHSILIAWADYEATGDARLLRLHYDTLKNEKLLLRYRRDDGLLATGQLRDPASGRMDIGDLVDWPNCERDGFDFRTVNTVVNAFHYRTLVLMEKIARAVSRDDDGEHFHNEAAGVYRRFNETCFDPVQGVYVDGEGSPHASQHANLFPLAFGLVPPEKSAGVIAHVKEKGMACSVYPAQFLLEGLFEAREADHAVGLITGSGLRSWKNMLDHGATLTWEAWDQSLKPNQDWNHAWGAAPGNIISRYVLGVRPLEPGYGRVLVDPQLGQLERIEGSVPTIRGSIQVQAWKESGGGVRCSVQAPANMEIVLKAS